jgi:tRNA-2-methylthio-N6-dimethylallyladenosine synthase
MASPDIIGQVLPMKIESLERYSLLGELATPMYAHTMRAASSHMTNGA